MVRPCDLLPYTAISGLKELVVLGTNASLQPLLALYSAASPYSNWAQ